MFIDAIIGGISLLRFWQVWVAIIISSLATTSYLLFGGLLSKNKTDLSMRTGCLMMIFGPIFQTTVTGIVIVYLMPILFGKDFATPLLILIQLLIPIFVVSCIAVIVVFVLNILFIRLIKVLFGILVHVPEELQIFIQNIIVFRLLADGYVSSIVARNNISHNIYPGLIEIAGLLLASWALLKLTLLASIISSAIEKIDHSIVNVILGFIGIFLPIFMYAQYATLSMSSKGNLLTTPLNLLYYFIFLYIVFGISRVWNDLMETDPLKRRGYTRHWTAVFVVMIWPILLYEDLFWFYQDFRIGWRKSGTTKETMKPSTSSIEKADYPMKILVVDDMIGIVESFKEILKIKGCYVKGALSGEEALDILSKESFDLMFTGFKMPVMDGMELLKIIQGKYPNMKRVMVTAYASEESVKKAFELGAMEYLRKPFLMPEVYALVERAAKELGKDLGPDFIKAPKPNEK